ncbi:MAG: hypothetical protein JXR63_12145, partial [Spirochaetales bacterium]|nr:hypothetical protein [Spirochaetales bacterium]
MIKAETKFFIFSIILFSIFFSALMIFSSLTFPYDILLISDKKFWLTFNTLRLFSRLILPVYLSFLIFFFAVVYPFSKRASMRQIPAIPILICIAMAGIITTIDEAFLPSLNDSYEQKSYQRQLAEIYHIRANKAFKEDDLDESYKYFTAYFAVDPQNAYDAYLIDLIKKENPHYKYLTAKDFYDQLIEKKETQRRLFKFKDVEPEISYTMKNRGE